MGALRILISLVTLPLLFTAVLVSILFFVLSVVVTVPVFIFVIFLLACSVR
jgi:hypothetical protein